MAKKNLTTMQALDYIVENRSISTGCLKALNMGFDTWLRYAQAPKDKQEKCVDLAIKILTNKIAGPIL